MKGLRGTVEKSREKEKKGKKEREERRGSVGKKWKETIFLNDTWKSKDSWSVE